MRIGLDYRPALVNGEGIGRYTRELVRGFHEHNFDPPADRDCDNMPIPGGQRNSPAKMVSPPAALQHPSMKSPKAFDEGSV